MIKSTLLNFFSRCYNNPVKLAIFIPAYNEQDTIGDVLAAIPKHFWGISQHKVLVVDDGSKDKTVSVAREHGAEVIEIMPNRGLANAFRVGLGACLDRGADVIAHLDADGQYDPAEIEKVIEPILKGEADMVTGDRQVGKCHFLGPARKYGNKAGSWFLRAISGLKVRDASSGFRAYNSAAAEKLEVHSTHTYTHETLIEARYKGIRIAEVPITFLPRGKMITTHDNRPHVTSGVQAEVPGTPGVDAPTTSRLTGNLFKHIFKSLWGIFEAMSRYGKRRR